MSAAPLRAARRLLFGLFCPALFSCHWIVPGLSAALCEEPDGAFLRCQDSAALLCYGGVEVRVGCAAGCEAPAGCVARCGDGALEPGEDCDGEELSGESCVTLGFLRGALSCDADCAFDLSGCASTRCGDGVKDPGEECDDGDDSNTDACTNDCKAATCGDGITEAGVEECDDANQNNNDSCLESCDLASCGDGVVFNDGGAEGCDDGNDQGGDGCDPNCQIEGTCQSPFVLQPPPPPQPPNPPPPIPPVNDDTRLRGTALLTGDRCASPQSGQELVFRMFLPVPPPQLLFHAHLVANDVGRDMSVYVNPSTCQSSSRGACDDDDLPSPGDETATATLPAGFSGDVFIVVDSKDAAGEGAFTLTLSLQ